MLKSQICGSRQKFDTSSVNCGWIFHIPISFQISPCKRRLCLTTSWANKQGMRQWSVTSPGEGVEWDPGESDDKPFMTKPRITLLVYIWWTDVEFDVMWLIWPGLALSEAEAEKRHFWQRPTNCILTTKELKCVLKISWHSKWDLLSWREASALRHLSDVTFAKMLPARCHLR